MESQNRCKEMNTFKVMNHLKFITEVYIMSVKL